jgi:Cys-tRNA(Pro) deacylase
MTVFEKIVELLDQNHIEYKLTEHEPVRTSEEAARVRGTDIHSGAKAMVAKSGSDYYLIVLPADKKIDWKGLKIALHVKDVSLAGLEDAEQVTGLKMGAVPPFGNLLNLQTIFDVEIGTIGQVNFNAGEQTHSISMKSSDLIALVKPTFGLISK